MRRKTALLVALIGIVAIPSSYIMWLLYMHRYGPSVFEREIVREPANLQEAMALAVAEYSNYSGIFSKPKLTGLDPEDPWVYDLRAYTWANFIDAEVIQYYNARFDNYIGKAWDKPREIEFRYEANVFTWDQIHVVYVPAPEGTNIYHSKIQVQSQNGSALLDPGPYVGPGWGMEFAYWNGSDYLRINASEIDFFLSESLIVEMTFEYKEIWGPLAAFYVSVHQLVIMDQHFEAVLLCVQSDKGIS